MQATRGSKTDLCYYNIKNGYKSIKKTTAKHSRWQYNPHNSIQFNKTIEEASCLQWDEDVCDTLKDCFEVTACINFCD